MATRARERLNNAKMDLEGTTGPGRVAATETALAAALEWLQDLAGPNVKPMGTRLLAEREYAGAYDALVQLGVRTPLRAKYRSGQ